jgi:hypothetical protein
MPESKAGSVSGSTASLLTHQNRAVFFMVMKPVRGDDAASSIRHKARLVYQL